MKKLALVLGGGAAKGFAHIGVIQILEEHGIKPDLIVGTSMGAVIGGIYASGFGMNKILEMSSKFSFKNISDISPVHMLTQGTIMRGKKIKNFIYSILKEVKHEDLQIPFTAVATELKTGKQHNLNKGLVWKNVLASSAMPAVFPSIEIDGKVLTDGGITDNLPIKVAKKLMPNAVILSIDVIGDYSKQVEEGGLKLMTQILNMSTLYISQMIDVTDSDLNVRITQPDVKQMDFNNKAVLRAIENGKRAMKRNIKKLKELLVD